MNTKNAHAAALQCLEDETYLALPKELWPEIKRHLAEDQLEVMKHLVGTIGNVFPNLSFLTNGKHLGVEWGGPEDRLISFLTLRQWQPKGAGKMEVWSWCFVDKNAPEWWKETSRECYLRAFGMAGMFEQDDMENWVDITQSLRGPIARQLWLQYKMGLGGVLSKKKPQAGPLHPTTPGEDSERAFYRHWQRLMMQV